MAGPHPLFERRDVAGENLNVILSAGKTAGKTRLEHFRILWTKVPFLTTTVPVPSASAQSRLPGREGCFVAVKTCDQPALESFHALNLICAYPSTVRLFRISRMAADGQ